MKVRAALLTRVGSFTLAVVDSRSALPFVYVSLSPSQNEGNSGTTVFVGTISRSTTFGAVDVQWTFSPGTTQPSDFVGGTYPTGGTVTIPSGQPSATFLINVQGDATVESNESFSVSILAPAGYSLGAPSTATSSILNDDAEAPALPGSISDLEVMAMGDGLHLMWTSASGALTHQYRQRATVGPGAWSGWNETNDPNDYHVQGLAPGTSYDFEVRGVNATAPGPSSNIGTRSTAGTAPSLPTPTIEFPAGRQAGDPIKFNVTGLVPDDVVGYDWYIEVGGGTLAVPDFIDGPGTETAVRSQRRQIVYPDFTGELAFTVLESLPSGEASVRVKIMLDDGTESAWSNVIFEDISAFENVTLNPDDKSVRLTLSDGNRTVTSESNVIGSALGVRATSGRAEAKWYYEVEIDAASTSTAARIGMATTVPPLTSNLIPGLTQSGTLQEGFHYNTAGNIASNNTTAAVAAAVAGDIIGIHVDHDAKLFWVAKNGVDLNGVPGVSGGRAYSATQPLHISISPTINSTVFVGNFDASAAEQTYTAATGFLPYNTDTEVALPLKVVAMGDSITAPGTSYANQWAALNPSVPYAELAVSGSLLGNKASHYGTTSTQMWGQLDNVLAEAPSIITLLAGENDDASSSFGSTGALGFYENVMAMSAKAKAERPGVKFVVMGVLPDPVTLAQNTRRAIVNPLYRQAQIDGLIDEYIPCGEHPEFTDNDAINGNGSGTYGAPDVHPTAYGQTILLKLYRAVVDPMVAGTTGNTATFIDTPADQTGVAVSTVREVKQIVTGMAPGTYVAASCDTGTIAINQGSFSTTPGNVKNGDTIVRRLTSSASDSTPVTQVLTVGSVTDSWSVTTAAAAGYTAQSVRFDGTDRLARGAALTGVVAGKTGTLSFWLNMKTSGFGPFYIFARSLGTGVRLERSSNNKITLVGANSSPTTILTIRTSGTFTDVTGWAHIMMSWDLATGRAQCYVNGVSAIDGAATITTNDNINYGTPDFGIGATSSSPAGFLNGAIADLYINMAASLDLSVQVNREKFILAGRPVDLGATGNLPTGSAPAVFLSGAAASWHTNKGAGGGFTLTGALVAGTDNP